MKLENHETRHLALEHFRKICCYQTSGVAIFSANLLLPDHFIQFDLQSDLLYEFFTFRWPQFSAVLIGIEFSPPLINSLFPCSLEYCPIFSSSKNVLHTPNYAYLNSLKATGKTQNLLECIYHWPLAKEVWSKGWCGGVQTDFHAKPTRDQQWISLLTSKLWCRAAGCRVWSYCLRLCCYANV